MSLLFFQRPVWCDKGNYLVKVIFSLKIHRKIKPNCKGNKEDPDFISTSNLPYLDNRIFALVEILTMSFLIYIKYVEYFWRPAKTLKVRNFFLVSFLIVTILSDIVYSFKKVVQLNSFIRPFFFVVYK
jgi:hypothetical protein